MRLCPLDQKFCQLLGSMAQAVSQQQRPDFDRLTKELYKKTKKLKYILKRGSIKLINEKKCHEYDYESAFNESFANFTQNCQIFLNYVISPDLGSWLINKERQFCLSDNIVRRYIGYFNKILIRNSFKQFNQIQKQTKILNQFSQVIVIELIEKSEDGTSKVNDIADPSWHNEIENIELRDRIDALKQCLIRDYSKVFQQTSLRERCDCNCQRIALELINSEGNLSEVAEKLKVNYNTLQSHWKRKCIPLIKQHCC